MSAPFLNRVSKTYLPVYALKFSSCPPAYLALLLMLLFPLVGFAQVAPDIEWEHSFGGSDDDRPYAMEATADGGYILTGHSNSIDGDRQQSLGGYDVWVIKLDAAGAMEWERSYGGTGDDHAYDVRQIADGGYVLTGSTRSRDGHVGRNQGGMDLWVLKLYANGTVDWERTYGGSGDDYAYAIQQTADGGYVATGYSDSFDGDRQPHPFGGNLWVVRLDANGTLSWEKSFGGNGDDRGTGIQQTTDGGFVVAGYTSSTNGDVAHNHGDYDAWILKLAADGSLDWERTYGGTQRDSTSELYTNVIGNDCIRQTTDGGYIVACTTWSNDGDVSFNHGLNDVWLLKLRADGTLDWEKCYGSSYPDSGVSILEAHGGGYIILGDGGSADGDKGNMNGGNDYWVFKVDALGTLLWERAYGGGFNDNPSDIAQVSGCELMVVGSTLSPGGDIDVGHNNGFFDFWAVKLRIDQDPPQVVSPQEFCASDAPVLADIAVTGDRLAWYDENGNPLPGSTLLQDGKTYHVSQTPDGCESDTAAVLVVLYGAAAPSISSDAPATVCVGAEATYTTESGFTGYTWGVSGGRIVNGGSVMDNSVTVQWEDLQNTFLDVLYDLGHGCGNSEMATYVETVSPCNGDLVVTKTVDRERAAVGERVTFTVGVTNLGTHDFVNVEVGEPVPSGFLLVSHIASLGDYIPEHGRWSMALLPGGATAVLELEAEVLATGGHTNTATLVSSDPIDTDASNNSASATVFPVLECPLVVYEGFSPNKDNINDSFHIECIEHYPDNNVKIYNRYGTLVYEGNGYDNSNVVFDGSSKNGHLLPVGVYFYVLTFYGQDNPGRHRYVGSLYLQR